MMNRTLTRHRRTRRHLPAGRGFSIVELMVAIGVLTFGVYAVYDQFLETGAASRRRLAAAQAGLLAHQRLAELRACRPADLRGWTPPAEWAPMQADAHFVQRTEITQRPDGMIDIRVTAGRAAPPDKAPGPIGQTVTVSGVTGP